MEPNDPPGPPQDQPAARILVAEDNAINREVIVEQLSLLGYRADVADDGQLAFERWQQGRHALLLTDLQMPRLDGYALTRAIRQHEADHGLPHTRIVALTACADPSAAAVCLRAGMDHHLPKPLDLGALQACLLRWVGGGAGDGLPRGEPATPAAMAGPPTAVPLMDPDALAQYVGDDPATLAWFRNDFRQRLGDAHRAMQAAWAHGVGTDWPKLADQAHQLKSTSRTVGALHLAACSQALEAAARRQAADTAAQAWADVATAVAATDQALAALVPSDTPPAAG
ncbi:MAG: hypothetical protein RJA10_1284 [Pseudomonadota bacterium]